MSHWPPDITDVKLNSDGTVTVKWEVDPILKGDPPDEVQVLVNGSDYSNHSNTDVTIDAPTVKASGALIAIEIDYVWRGNPDDRQASGLQLPLPSSTTGITPTSVHQRPTVAVKKRLPKTLQTQNSITTSWSAYSITDADLYWGEEGATNRHVKLSFSAQHYGGDVTTDAPLAPGRMYEFKVVVQNKLDGWGPYTAAVVARSASNYLSLRQFLIASAVRGPSVRSALGIRGAGGIRSLLGV
jgi:hypothetical protein